MATRWGNWVTQSGTSSLFYQAKSWTKITLMLDTDTDTFVGEQDPLTGKNGFKLSPDVPVTIELSPGDRIYLYAAQNTNVSYAIQEMLAVDLVTQGVKSIAESLLTIVKTFIGMKTDKVEV